MDANGNGTALWKTIAMALLTGVVGWFAHTMLEAGSRTSQGDPTGWTADQKQAFLNMPDKIDSIWVVGQRERWEIRSYLVEIKKALRDKK